MSNTHKTKPLGVKVYQGHVGYREYHNHTKGPCDLPPFSPDNTGFPRPTRCTWEPNFYEPLSFCGCRLCSSFHDSKLATRRDRHRAKQKMRDYMRDPEAFNEEVLDDRKELW